MSLIGLIIFLLGPDFWLKESDKFLAFLPTSLVYSKSQSERRKIDLIVLAGDISDNSDLS